MELHRPFTIQKDCWDKLDLLRVRQATNPAATADLAVLLIAVSTLCRACLLPSVAMKAQRCYWQR